MQKQQQSHPALPQAHPPLSPLVFSKQSPQASKNATVLGIVLSMVSIAAHAGSDSWTPTSVSGANIGVSALVTGPDGNSYTASNIGVYKRNDSGSIWATQISPDTTVSLLAVDAKSNVYCAASTLVYACSKGSATAQRFDGVVTSLAIDGNASLYAGVSGSGIYKSQDGGLSWNAVNTGLAVGGSAQPILAADKQGNLFAATGGGLYRSQNGGNSWSLINHWPDFSTMGAGVFTGVSSLATDTTGALYAIAEIREYNQWARQNLYKSTDQGMSWTLIEGNYPSGSAPSNGNLQFAIASNGDFYTWKTQATYATTEVYPERGAIHKYGKSGLSYISGIDQCDISALTIASNGDLYAATPASKGYSVSGAPTGCAGTPLPGVYRYSPTGAAIISGWSSGMTQALTLDARITAANADIGKTGNLYIAALLPTGQLFMLTPSGWTRLTGQIPAYGSTTLGTSQIRLLDGSTDVSSLIGTIIFAGYGTDSNDMLTQRKFAPIYTIK